MTSRPRLGAVALATLGCKVNQAESEEFARSFAARGLRLVSFDQPADAYVINSCTVTHVADRKSRQMIRQARRANPAALIVATGCYAAMSPASLAKAIPIDLVIPNADKSRLVPLVLEALGSPSRSSSLLEAKDRTRAFVKIQDGCDSVCSFCIIPYARGRERSVSPAEVSAAIAGLSAAGHREIVLTGVHLGTYGQDLTPPASLANLLETALGQLAPASRLRLSSIEPWSFDPATLQLWDDKRLCRHFHFALQSGSDSVLTRMRRPYSTAQFSSLLASIRARVPAAAVTTDVIVGFPGETEAEFAESLRHVAELGFARIHVFPYSSRARTAASRMPNQVPPPVKQARVAAMLFVARQAAASFHRRFIGEDLEVLFEREVEMGGGARGWEGLTDNYIRVVAAAPVDLTNRLEQVHLIGEEGDALRGEALL